MNLKKLIPVVLCIFILNLAYADAPPPFMLFRGTAKMNDADVPIGTLIEAFIVDDNDPSVNDGSFLVDTLGEYDLAVTGTISDINKVIIFHIDGVKANENSTFLPMGYEELDLTTGSCIETWSCTEWSSCSDGTQTRTCTNICDVNNTKTELQSCASGGGSSGGGGGGGGGGTAKPKPAISTVTLPPKPTPMPAKPKEEEKPATLPTQVETPPPVAPAEQITAPTPAIAGVTGAAIIGAAYQERTLIIVVLTVLILLIIGLFIYSHAKNIKNWPFHFKFRRKRWVVLAIILVIFISLFTRFVLLNYFRSAS